MEPVSPIVQKEKLPFDKAPFGSEPQGRRQGRAKPKVAKKKHDPKHVAAARELRDRWLECVNADPAALTGAGKYEVARQLSTAGTAEAIQQGRGMKLLDAA
jgi:hypothetical protein